jgi:hypothetical protein
MSETIDTLTKAMNDFLGEGKNEEAKLIANVISESAALQHRYEATQEPYKKLQQDKLLDLSGRIAQGLFSNPGSTEHNSYESLIVQAVTLAKDQLKQLGYEIEE